MSHPIDIQWHNHLDRSVSHKKATTHTHTHMVETDRSVEFCILPPVTPPPATPPPATPPPATPPPATPPPATPSPVTPPPVTPPPVTPPPATSLPPTLLCSSRCVAGRRGGKEGGRRGGKEGGRRGGKEGGRRGGKEGGGGKLLRPASVFSVPLLTVYSTAPRIAARRRVSGGLQDV
ncbi:hypothetical protein FHG87_017868 [Trinorchestia longiramus]|nr:hypothetical protein FHG87_017868 [Trinorchestia longiramus]